MYFFYFAALLKICYCQKLRTSGVKLFNLKLGWCKQNDIFHVCQELGASGINRTGYQDIEIFVDPLLQYLLVLKQQPMSQMFNFSL